MRNKAVVIAYYTFQDLLKSKVLFNVVLIGLALVLMSFVASEFTYGVPERIALDFGLGTLSLSTIAIAILMGVGLISNELDSRTIYMTLSRPVSRVSFLLGKSMGMGLIFVINILILSILTLGFYFYLGGKFNSLIFWNVLYTILEAFICLFVVVFFSLITNKTLSVIMTFFLYLAGHAVNEGLIEKFESSYLLGTFLKKYHYLFPGFHKLNIKDFLLYQENLNSSFVFQTLGYGCFYLLGVIFLTCIVFEKKNLD